MTLPRPQETGCTTIELPDTGRTNGVLSMLNAYYDIEYDEDDDVYRVYESRQGPKKGAVEVNKGP